jgi:hypothetical protein
MSFEIELVKETRVHDVHRRKGAFSVDSHRLAKSPASLASRITLVTSPQFFSFYSFSVCETGWHPEKVGNCLQAGVWAFKTVTYTL